MVVGCTSRSRIVFPPFLKLLMPVNFVSGLIFLVKSDSQIGMVRLRLFLGAIVSVMLVVSAQNRLDVLGQGQMKTTLGPMNT